MAFPHETRPPVVAPGTYLKTSGFAAATHTHDPGDITGLDDYLSSVVGGLLVEGAGIDLTQDSISGAITIEATGSGGGVAVRDEGATLTASAGFLDFVGAGVAASTVSGGVQVSVPGATGLGVRDEGSTLTGAAGFLDFVGSGVTATTVSGGVQVSVPGGSGGESQANKAHTVPTSSGWSWVNQGSATVTDRAYSMVLFQPRIASENWAFLVRSTPSTPYTMTLRHRHFGRVGSGNTGWGVGWRTNSDGKFHICRFGQNSSWFDLSITGHNSVTSGVTTTTQGAVRVIAIPEWIKIADDGANRSVQISPNGDDWTTLWSGGRTTFTTPDQLCIGANNVLGTTPYLDFIVNVHSLVIA